MKQIVKDSVVILSYEVTDPDGNVLDAGEEPLIYLHGGYDDVFSAIEQALQGKSVGDTVMVKMQPEQAYGEYDAELVLIESLDVLPQPLAIGMQIEGEPEGRQGVLWRVGAGATMGPDLGHVRKPSTSTRACQPWQDP